MNAAEITAPEAEELTPEQIDALNHKKKLASENAATRKRLRETEKKLAQAEARLLEYEHAEQAGCASRGCAAKIERLSSLVTQLAEFVNAYNPEGGA